MVQLQDASGVQVHIIQDLKDLVDQQQQIYDDNVYLVQPLQFLPLDHQFYGKGTQWIVPAPAATGSTPGQQTQYAITIPAAMWRMLSSMFAQQQHQVFSGFPPRTPRTTDTPLGTRRFPGTWQVCLDFRSQARCEIHWTGHWWEQLQWELFTPNREQKTLRYQ